MKIKIEVMYETPRVNVKVERVQLLRLDQSACFIAIIFTVKIDSLLTVEYQSPIAFTSLIMHTGQRCELTLYLFLFFRSRVFFSILVELEIK